jgi:protein ImuA
VSRPSRLPAHIAAFATARPVDDGPRVRLGLDSVDDRLGGGLAQAALHEIYAAREGDGAAAAGFALLLALRCERDGPLVWLREDRAHRNGRLYGLGLAELGFDPDRLLLVQAPDTLALLRAGAEAVACSAVAVVILEPWGKAAALDLTATRRLTLAAARSGVLTLLLRSGEPGPSAAQSRWQVAAAPSQLLPANAFGGEAPGARVLGGEAPGAPAFDISLLRHRSGIAGFDARMEWDRDRRIFAAPIPGTAPAAAVQRAGAAAKRRAA